MAVDSSIVRGRILAAAAVLACAVVAYSNAMPPVAIHDDAFFVPARHRLSAESVAQVFTEDMWSSTGSPAGVYRPLVLLSIAADGAVHGRDPSGYHRTNVALHAIASLAVFVLLALLAGPGGTLAAGLAAALFAVHPVHTEVVCSVYNRSEMLSTTLVASALALLLRFHRQQPAAAWTGAALLYFAALLCRESAVSLPALAVLMLWIVPPQRPWREKLVAAAPALLLAIPLAEYFVLRSFALSSTVKSAAPSLGVDAGHDLASRLLHSIAALAEYARMMVWPWPLRVSYEDFAGTNLVATAAVHTLLLGAAVAARRRAPLVSFAVAFFYVSLLPSTRLFTSSGLTLRLGDFVLLSPQGGLVLVAERVAYLPSVAAAVAATAGLKALSARVGVPAMLAVAGTILVVLGLVTHGRNRDWHSAVDLFAAEVRAAPDNGDGWRLYVSALSSAGRMEEAAGACDEQFDREDRSAQFFNNCGVAYDRLGRDEDAMRAYRRTIERGLAPVGHANLGRVLARLGRTEEARAEFQAAIDSETNPAQRHWRTGLMLMRFHPDRVEQARGEFEKALEIRPDFAAARKALESLPR